MERSGVRLRLEDSAKWNATDAQDRGRGILLQLLTQITEFLERKEMMSSRVAASNEWRKSRSRRHAESSNNLFEVVLQVCGQRMRRLKRSERDQDELSAQSPRVLVAEAIVQELLVSLMELRMKEKETMVMDEVENVEVMRKLHVHLKRDEEQVRNRVCVGAGDEQQLEELQLMLRTDFLEEVASADSPQKRQQTESAANNEASLQFAWETIDDQKKEIVRLRAENEELKRSTGRSSSLKASLLDDDPAKVIEHLRSQLSSHHDKNLDILQDHIQRLERALQTATATARKKSRGWDGSRSTMDSSRSTEQDDWSSLLSRSAVGTDFSRTQVPRRKCEECRKSAASLLALRSEVKQLRAHAATDEESLVQAEKDRGQLQRENAALSTGLLTAKQKQEELRQMIVDLTQEKHQLQNLSDSEERTSERTICLLKDQLGALEKQKAHQKRKLDELIATYDAECSEKQALMKTYAELEETNMDLSKSATELQAQMTSLKEFAERQKEVINAQDVVVTDLRAQLNSKEQDGKTQATALQKKQAVISNLKAELSELQLRLDKLESEKRKASGENERLLQTLDECKRKNQRLELGIEELKQGKELIVSLQQVERENSALQHSELQQAREQINSMNIQLSSTKTECIKLEQALAEMKEANDTLRQDRDSAEAQHTKEVKQLRDELKAMQQDRTVLEEQVKAQEELQEKLDTMKRTSVGQKEQIGKGSKARYKACQKNSTAYNDDLKKLKLIATQLLLLEKPRARQKKKMKWN
ncbi:hypothetical protein PHYBOEH_009498 [Phytophthora boehmeriae]|uniref:Uncharacterized protein n=1 Tax=Phytophthora boehmeriae TaxID=109152 RepID=A0A8T1XCA0_9STRA|nr:hypothetical protein PHYBOEH_009498 [Phytophthora boehmeriae]